MRTPMMRPLVLVTLLGCTGPAAGTGPAANLPECGGPVTVSVSGGTAPTFDWTPACRLQSLQVWVAPNNFPNKWTVAAAGNTIGPGVRYAVAPDSTNASIAEPLLRGQTYAVFVSRRPSPGTMPVEIGSRQFTP